MWPFSVPPYKGDERVDLGVWHPSVLPADKQNKEGYHMLEHRIEEDWTSETNESCPTDAVKAIQGFHDEVIKIIDGLPDDETNNRPWSVVLRCSTEFHLISLWPSVAVDLLPSIMTSANRHGLVCFDSQSGTLTLPQSTT